MNYVAVDLGAESGRIIFGPIDHEQVTLAERHRFPNTPLRAGASLQWDIASLWDSVASGVTSIANDSIDGISVDSWGVDYVLFDAEDRLIEPTFHYRDPRTK